DLTVGSTGPPCTVSGGDVTCDAIDLADGGTFTVTIDGTIAEGYTGAPLTNTATATSPTGEPGDDETEGRSDSVDTTVAAAADLSVTKTPTVDMDEPVAPGERVAWAVTVTNDGPSTATDVQLTDLVAADLSAVTFDAPAGVTCTAGVCDLGTIASGDSVTVTVSGRLD